MTEKLDDDQWIAENSPISAKKLHALGVVNFHWNIVDQLLRVILCNIRGHSSGAYTPATNSQIKKIKELSFAHVVCGIKSEMFYLKHTENSLQYMRDIISAAEICRRNRNGLVHYFIDGFHNPSRGEMKIVRDFFHRKIELPDSLTNIRQVAKETEALWMVMSEMLGHLTILWSFKIDQLNRTIPTPADLFSNEALRDRS
ncbi:MAG: hypothetical protein EOO38_01990 [Cytophagaceae bacterium]|nr:MAG: hypothetical protein EOO38_01990 [Cytophagaceae bacterium]